MQGREPTESDYMSAGQRHGGHIAEIPLPHLRKFPNPYHKRQVKVTITRYYGLGAHYYVSLREEENPIWTGTVWQTCWDDEEAKGKTDTNLYFDGDLDANIRVEAYAIAKAKAERLVKKHFPGHEIKWEDYCKDWENLENDESLRRIP